MRNTEHTVSAVSWSASLNAARGKVGVRQNSWTSHACVARDAILAFCGWQHSTNLYLERLESAGLNLNSVHREKQNQKPSTEVVAQWILQQLTTVDLILWNFRI